MTKRAIGLICVLMLLLFISLPSYLAFANPPVDREDYGRTTPRPAMREEGFGVTPKVFDEPNPKDYRRFRLRQKLLEQGKEEMFAVPRTTAKSGTDVVLMILVEFAGTDTFTWTQGISTWDPIGKADPNEYTGTYTGTAEDCSKIITETKDFTYTGPLHNQIARPLSADDRSGDTIWTPDFNPDYYRKIAFKKGITFNYTREDGSVVKENRIGKSVNNYFKDMSGGLYKITGDVIGWLQIPHSVWWYGADTCPGSRSGTTTTRFGAIPGAGSAKSLVRDALDAVKGAYPSFDWAKYDQDGDGVIDRLWIIYAGLGEEDATVLLDRTNYGEGTLWSHSSSLSPPYEVSPGISAGPYIMMPENCGIGVLAHEHAHSLGAIDLYAYSGGAPSAGFWTLMADDWTGYPIAFQPPAIDPYHLDYWGWLNPYEVSDPSKIQTITVGQASKFPGGKNVYRGAKIRLPEGVLSLPVQPTENYQWWGGKEKLLDATMTLKNSIPIPSGSGTLSFSLAYDIQTGWDFLWVQASADNGTTWTTLTNGNTTCTHEAGWIGTSKGFPDDLCGAGVGGFTGKSSGYPSFGTETFDLNTFAGQDVLFRFWYMTDWGNQWGGPFIDNMSVTSGADTLFSDDAEDGDGNWTYAEGWSRNDGTEVFTHYYYLQFRNVMSSGGYDSALGDSRWRFGPANSGLVIWYNNNHYDNNEIYSHLNDEFGFGPKAKMLVVDAHPDPYRDPYYLLQGYENEGANVDSRSLMRDAPFSLFDSVDFTMKPTYVYEETQFEGRPGVSLFDDALGYYPGAEYVSRGPGYDPPRYIWDTKQWDASVTIPSTLSYGINAPGYLGSEQLRFYCSRYTGGKLSCSVFSSGLGYDGTTGNPGDMGGEYGWKVKILKQDQNTAKIRIWNSRYAIAPDLKGEWVSLDQTCHQTSGGQKCQINGTFKILNVGDVNAASTYVNFYLSDDNTYSTGDELLKKVATGKVPTGSEKRKVLAYTFPVGKSASGKYIIAVIDPMDTIAEVHEDDNETEYYVQP